MVTEQLAAPRTARVTLSRVTAAGGLVTLVLVLGTSIANGYQSAPFTSDTDQVVSFFRSLDDALGAAGSWLTSVGLIAMLWFAIGLALLLRRYEGELPWRSAFLAGAGVVSVVSGQIASWDAAVYRSADIDPQVARYAFDLGNLSFANGWVATGALAVCAGSLVLSSDDLPRWLGWSAVVIGVAQVLARAFWTSDLAFVPFTLFWIWTAALCVLLLTGRFARSGPEGVQGS
jgi:uncharacterized membrane protein